MHWYFTSALPRMLHASYPLALLAPLLNRRARPLMFVALGFVGLYSFLGHKEVRFLFPTVPLWNFSAALSIHAIFFDINSRINVLPKAMRRLVRLAVVSALVIGCMLTAVSSLASYDNYPGGKALSQLHKTVDQAYGNKYNYERNNQTVISIHIDAYAAMNGISRFLERGAPYVYSKAEGIPVGKLQDYGFDFVINEHRNIDGYTRIQSISSFDHLALCGGSPAAAVDCFLRFRSPVEFVVGEKVHVFKRNTVQ